MKTLLQRLTSAAALYAGVANCDLVKTCPSSAQDVCFQVGVPQASASAGSGDIFFQITAPTSYTWVALGTGTKMDGSNIFLMYQDGTGNLTLSPRLGTPHTPPTLDTSSTAAKLTLLAGSGVSGNTMTANVMCSNCNSWNGGSGKMSLSSTSSGWIGGWLSGSSMATTDKAASIQMHSDVSTFTIDLTKATISADKNPFVGEAATSGGAGGSGSGSGGATGSDTGSGVTVISDGPPSKTVKDAHGIIMALVFVIMYPAGSLLMPLLGNWQAHAALQMVVWLLMWAGFGLGVQAAKDRNILFAGKHTNFGTVIVCLLVIQPALGFLHHKMYLKTGGRTVVSHAHIWYGRVLMFLGLVNGGLGLKLARAGDSLTIAYGVVGGIMYVIYLAGGLYGENKRKRAGGAVNQNKETITLNETPNKTNSA